MPLLRPVRAQLAATRARVAHVATPAPAWQTLADDGSIPTAWLDDTGRSFILETPTRDPPMASWSEPPATLARCALRLARRSRATSTAFSPPKPRPGLSPTRSPRGAHSHARAYARGVVVDPPRELWLRVDRHASVCHLRAPARLRRFGEIYRAAARSDLPLGFLGNAASWVAPWVASWDAVFPGRANPFRALAQIESTGYAALEHVARDGTVFLVAPEDDPAGDVR